MHNQKWTVAMTIFGLSLLATPFAQDDESNIDGASNIDRHSCSSKETCGSCIQTKGCAWCLKPDEGNSSLVRCAPYHEITHDEDGYFESGRERRAAVRAEWCPKKYIFTLKSYSEIISNESLKPASKIESLHATDAVQITPQKVKLHLRVDETFKLQLQYKQAEDYPVDLYYLMDLSNSMADDKDSLSKLGNKLTKEMMKLTSNFRLGFGSFVDKTVMPFVSTVPSKLKKPCDDPVKKKPCAPPYGFINHMPLSSNTAQFEMKVNEARVSGNLDAPEGGLDALMQVIVCHKEIGWREKARRIIVLSTDAVFHLAGDGKLAGVVEPNDGECHLENNKYTHGELIDYPSISQLNVKVRENNMIVIFAVTSKQTDAYEALAQRIVGASYGILSKDSSNVVKLVSQQYEKLVRGITLADDAESHIEVKYFSSCLNHSMEEYETKECGGLRVGNLVNFTAHIRVLRCPETKSERKSKFSIKPQGLSEALEIELEMFCDCPCEKPGHQGYVENSPECSESGTLECGICKCNKGKVGKKCHCNRGSVSGKDPDDLAGCIPGGNISDPGAVICSNLGECKCGVCECKKRDNPLEKISGKYCECDNFSCKRHGDKTCSGPEHGTCNCGECVCNTGWKGAACECKNSNDTCIRPGSSAGENPEICSGHGECICGQCHCKIEGKTRYSGKYCEECPTCTGRCKELGDCVECQVFGSSSTPTTLTEQECNKCSFKVQVVETLSKDESSIENDQFDETEEIEDSNIIYVEGAGEVRHCSLPDLADCTFFFDYWYDEDKNLIVRAQKKKQCAPDVNVLGVILSVIGSIVLAGLILLLVWKLLTSIHDRREYIRFEKERQMAKWDAGENPLYQKAVTNFNNPTFGK